MEAINLPAGTRVKHGTAAANLESILDSGLQPGKNRHQLRALTEADPTSTAVYVGGLSAYFGAWAATAALIREYELAEPAFRQICDSTDPNALRSTTYSSPPFTIPVVLEIEIAEDVLLVGDEDYVLTIRGSERRHPDGTAWNIWSQYGSGGIQAPAGIPADWIKSFEFPQLVQIGGPTPTQANRLGPDSILFAAGVHQNHNVVPLKEVQLASGPWTESARLSQKCAFTRAEVAKFFGFAAVRDPGNRLHNMIIQYNFVSEIGRERYGLTFV